MSPSLLKVIPLPTTTPFLAVINPTESISVTSSYVNVCAIDTFPLNVALFATMLSVETSDTLPVLP